MSLHELAKLCIVAAIIITLIRVVKPEETVLHDLTNAIGDVKTSIAQLLHLQTKTESTYSKYLNLK